MAIKSLTTVKATIQMRHGLEEDFDPDKMTAGEWAVSTDKKFVRMCFAPGVVVRMATYEAFEQDMSEIQTILATCEDIQVAVEAMANLAERHKNAAAASASTASAKATDAANSAEAANTSAAAAEASKTAAASSVSTASTKAGEAAISATNAANSAAIATQKAAEAGTSAANAASSAGTATSKANAASTSATNAANSAASADTYAQKSKSYAVGGTGTREGENTDNAKYYYEQSRNISQGLGGALLPMGTISFANLPLLSDAESGWMYNVSDQFTTTVDFNEGSGKIIPGGANVYKTADGKWDVLSGTPVTTVNGQTGNVSITAESIGALPEDGNAASSTKATQDGNGDNIASTYLKKTGDSSETNASFVQAAQRENIKSGEKVSVILGKIAKWFSDLKSVAFLSPTNNLLANVAGTALDAVQGAVLKDLWDQHETKINKINSDLTPIQIGMDFIAGAETSAGTMVASTCVKCGKVIQFQFGITLNKNISVGGVISLSGFKYVPINTLNIYNKGYSVNMYSNGKANIENTGPATWETGETKYFNGVYITA